MNCYDFYRKLHGRGTTLESLAAKLGTTHSHLSQVFNGKRGAHTRKHIAKLLTVEETTLLGWKEQGEFVPQGTLSHMEQLQETEPTIEEINARAAAIRRQQELRLAKALK